MARYRRNPELIHVVAIHSEADVLRHWRELYRAGKHEGAEPDLSLHRGKSDTWVEVLIPHALTNADWNTDGLGTDLAEHKVVRARAYAAAPGPLPPGMASYSGRARRAAGRVFVTDGNHRAHASYLRGEPCARFYMPITDFRRFADLHSDRVVW